MPPKKFVLLICFAFFAQFLFSQYEPWQENLHALQLDGVIKDKSTSATKTLITKWQYLNQNYHATLYDSLPAHVWQSLLEERYADAIKLKDTALQVKIAIPLAYVLHVQSKFEKGIPVLEFLYSRLNQFDYKMQGTILIKLEEEHRSLNNIRRVITIRKERIQKGYIKTFWEIYYNCGLYREAIEDFKLFEPIPPIATRERMAYFIRIGDMFYDAQIIDSAEQYYKTGIKEADIYINEIKTKKLKDQGNVYYWKGLFSGLVGKCMIQRGQYQQAIPLISYQLQTSKDGYRLGGLLSLGNCYLHVGKVGESIKLLDSAAFYMQDATHEKANLEYYKIKADYFQTIHQYDSSLSYLKLYNLKKELALSATLKNQSVFLLGRLELENRRKELAVTQNQLQESIVKTGVQQNQLLIAIVALIIFAVGIIFMSILYRQKEKAKKEIEAKSFLLERYAQMNLNKSKHNEQLVKELHHRVKNNLQNIYSLLNIQKRRIEDKASIDFVASIQNRINSMAIVHESLYADENIESVDFEQYARNLIQHIQLSFEKENHSLLVEYEIEACEFSLEKIILLGLIINETVSNVFKYAVSGEPNTTLKIVLKKTDLFYQLTIKDNGPGFDPSSVRDNSLGLKLIQTMCLQLEATYTLKTTNGVEHTIIFNA